MTYETTEIRKKILEKNVFEVFEDKYSYVGPIWTSQQLEWCNGIYQPFKDHDKYLIIIYLIKKTLDLYSRNFIKLTYDEFYMHDTIEVEKFNMMELSKVLTIPKETTRRKIAELKTLGIIKKNEKKTIIDRSVFPLIKPKQTTQRISRFLALFSKTLVQEKVLFQQFDSADIENIIKKNFSYVWKIYYEMQIPMLLEWKKVFNDFDTWHVWAACGVNISLDLLSLNDRKEKNRDQFLNEIFFSNNSKIQGSNAMSLSDITGIPRATVVRKLNNLVKLNYLTIDKKKLYRLSGDHSHKIKVTQKNTIEQLTNFATTIYNLMLIDNKKKQG